MAAEVVPPTEDSEAGLIKTLHDLAAGARQVQLVSPAAQTVTIYRSPTNVPVLGMSDEIEGGEVLRGFLCPVVDLFALSIRCP